MSRLLYIQASPRGGRSHSIAVADAFVESYRESHPEDEITTLNVFTTDLPSFDGLALQAKYTILQGKDHTREELAAWRAVEAVIEAFRSTDRYVFAVPMWNFGIPYRLKQFIDVIVQPGYTFSFSPEKGYQGLLSGRPVFVAYARGGEYPEGDQAAAIDFQRRYMEVALRFMGLTDIRSIVLQPTLMGGPEAATKRQADAVALARRMAKEF